MHLGNTELLLILAIAIVLFGSTKIAGLGKALGKSIREFKEEVKIPDDKNENSAVESND